ncbi:TauD/TfdA family dioxygenase [Vibrio agarilyticus]|nr:TauD/TfdA family dioxygenase [Vibrio agarilyticus]
MYKYRERDIPPPTINEIHLSYDANRKIKNAFQSLRLNGDNAWLNARDWLGSTIQHAISPSQLSALVKFKQDPAKTALIIRGLPIDSELGATPYGGYLAPEKTPVATGCHIGIYQLMQIEPISYINENKGLLFRHVVPSTKGQQEKSSHGSIHTFGHHVDNPDLPLKPEPIQNESRCPEFLSLMALRSDLKVRSNFILLDDIINNLSQGVIEELKKANYHIQRPDSFGQAKITRLPLVVCGPDGVLSCRYDKENTTPLTEQAAAALVMLEAQLKNGQIKNDITYQPGDFLIIKNQRVLHSREGFRSRNDGADRWLIRLFGMSSLDQIISINNASPHIGKD